MTTIAVDDIKECDPLDRPLLPYRIAKNAGIKKGVVFHTPAGNLKAVEYIVWNPATNHRICAFACEEVK